MNNHVDDIGDDIIECWCGARGTYDELFDDSGLADCCGGMGTLDCECGGDQCVCHHHGEVECCGCPDCDDFDSDYDLDERDYEPEPDEEE